MTDEDITKNFHKQIGQLWLTDYQMDILSKYNIDYTHFKDLNELIYYLEDYLNSNANDELEDISMELSEFNYYHNTNK